MILGSASDIAALVEKSIRDRVERPIAERNFNQGGSKIGDCAIDERSLAMNVYVIKIDHGNSMAR
jgi:hypothetical protein